jgi:hypothetical protein
MRIRNPDDGNVTSAVMWILMRISKVGYIRIPCPDPSIIKQKSRENLDFYCFRTSLLFFILTDVKKNLQNVPVISILKANDEKSRIQIRIRKSVVQISGSGSVSQWYGSAVRIRTYQK